MISSLDEFYSGIEAMAESIKEYQTPEAEFLGMSLKAVLTDYTLIEMPPEYKALLKNIHILDVDNGELRAEMNEEYNKVKNKSMSLGKSLKTGLLVKQDESRDLDTNKDFSLYAMRSTSSTDTVFDLVMFNTKNLKPEFDDKGNLKFYGIIIDCNQNPQFVDTEDTVGRTINLLVDTPTIIIGPETGRIHGIADYRRHQLLAQNIKADTPKKDLMQPVYVSFKNEDRLIPRQDAYIVDSDLYLAIQATCHDYDDVLKGVFLGKNIKFEGNEEANEALSFYKELAKTGGEYGYLNRELEGETTIYGENKIVHTLRVDVTSEKSMNSKSYRDFTASKDFKHVDKVITVIPYNLYYEVDTSEIADYIEGVGFHKEDGTPSQITIYVEGDHTAIEEFDHYNKPNKHIEQVSDTVYEIVNDFENVNYKAYLVPYGYRFEEVN